MLYSTAACCSAYRGLNFLGGVSLFELWTWLVTFLSSAHSHLLHYFERAEADWLGKEIKSTVPFGKKKERNGSDYLQAHGKHCSIL